TYGYDSQGRLTRVEPQKTGEPSVASNYSYDKAGNILAVGNAVTNYVYNDASQLVSSNGTTTGWSYDKAGNETAAAP
ncbi:hypothetical protein ADL06_15145, partial [Streptomyces sp. NRRL F-6491]